MVMPDGSEPLTIRVAAHVDEIDAADWDACAGTLNPFVSHAFLCAGGQRFGQSRRPAGNRSIWCCRTVPAASWA